MYYSDDDAAYSSCDSDEEDETTRSRRKMYEQANDDDPHLAAVSKAIENAELPGDFFSSMAWGRYPQPGLVIDGSYQVTIPLIEARADGFVASCTAFVKQRADVVQRTYEVATLHVEVMSAHWPPFISSVVNAMRGELGMQEDVQLIPRLQRLVLYEAGAFRSKARVRSNRRAVCSMVVVLPSVFQGADMIVYEPTFSDEAPAMRAWSGIDANPFAVHGGVFYHDCELEIKTIRSGYLLCMEYDLEVNHEAPAPTYCGNHESYYRLQDALSAFFASDGVRADERDDLERVQKTARGDRKLVYALQQKYIHRTFSFDNFGEDDLRVARALAKFCTFSQGLYRLYLCRLVYTHVSCYPGSSSKRENTVQLRAPWVPIDPGDPVNGEDFDGADPVCSGVYPRGLSAHISSEIVPCRFFNPDTIRFDSYKNRFLNPMEDDSSESWQSYESGALVIFPLKLFFRVRFAGSASTTIDWWTTLCVSHKNYARQAASVFASSSQRWSLASPLSVKVVDALRHLKELQLVEDLLTCCEFKQFEAILSALAECFKWSAVLAMAKRVCRAWRQSQPSFELRRYRVNFVASILHGQTDPSRITEMLGGIEANPFTLRPSRKNLIVSVDYAYLSSEHTQPDEYARILALAWRVSPQFMRSYLQTPDDLEAVCAITPALLLFVESTFHPTDELPMTIRDVVLEFRCELISRFVRIRHISYLQKVYCDILGKRQSQIACTQCQKLKLFLRSDNGATTFKKAKFVPHVQKTIEDSYFDELLAVEASTGTDGQEIVKVTKCHDNELFKMAVQMVEQLNKVLMRTVGSRDVSCGVFSAQRMSIGAFAAQMTKRRQAIDSIGGTSEYAPLAWTRGVSSYELHRLASTPPQTRHSPVRPWHCDSGGDEPVIHLGMNEESKDGDPDPMQISAVSSASPPSVARELIEDSGQLVKEHEEEQDGQIKQSAQCIKEQNDDDEDVCFVGSIAAQDPPVDRSYWTSLLNCDVKTVDGDGYCLYRAYLTATSPVLRSRFTPSEIVNTKREVMDIVIKTVKREIKAALVDPHTEAKNLGLKVSASASVDELHDAIKSHYEAVRDRGVSHPAPRSHWGGPPQLQALAKLGKQPVFVIDEFRGATFVQLYTWRQTALVGTTNPLSRAKAEQVFKAYLENRVSPIVLVLIHAESGGHFDALPILATHYDEWTSEDIRVTMDMAMRRRAVHQRLGLLWD